MGVHTPTHAEGLFLVLGHVFPQHFVDARLPALALLPVSFQHVGVDAAIDTTTARA